MGHYKDFRDRLVAGQPEVYSGDSVESGRDSGPGRVQRAYHLEALRSYDEIEKKLKKMQDTLAAILAKMS